MIDCVNLLFWWWLKNRINCTQTKIRINHFIMVGLTHLHVKNLECNVCFLVCVGGGIFILNPCIVWGSLPLSTFWVFVFCWLRRLLYFWLIEKSQIKRHKNSNILILKFVCRMQLWKQTNIYIWYGILILTELNYHLHYMATQRFSPRFTAISNV